ncbi:MAG: ribonuclease III [Casimicrobiaceae bacterium]|nr:ribonuclease III [Pseudomonadota bacterium]
MSVAPRIPLDHAFANPELLRQALTHRSYGAPNNERLEFVGDAVLNCVVARTLFERFPGIPEGDLSRARANLVNKDTLAQVARRLGLGGVIRLGEGEIRSGGTDRASILADAMEAVFGAVFLDGGFEAARGTIDAVYADLLRDADPTVLGKDPKTRLQEWLQSKRLPVPEYAIVATTGEAHAQRFAVECRIPDLGIVATGSGASRRAAEQDAALQALEMAIKVGQHG